jgi:hypothetical protein
VISPLIPLLILGIIGLGVYAYQADKKRREAMAAWARARGWRLRPGKVQGLEHDYPALKVFKRGHSRSAKNTITGEYEGRPVRLMDYHYVTGHGKNRSTHNIGVVIMQTEFPVIPLHIRRENPFDKVGEFLGKDDIDFESAEFSRKFYVTSHDRKWAYDVIHQGAMDYLLGSPSYDIAFGFQEIAITKRGHFAPDKYDEALALAHGLYRLIPDYVVQQMKGDNR